MEGGKGLRCEQPGAMARTVCSDTKLDGGAFRTCLKRRSFARGKLESLVQGNPTRTSQGAVRGCDHRAQRTSGDLADTATNQTLRNLGKLNRGRVGVCGL